MTKKHSFFKNIRRLRPWRWRLWGKRALTARASRYDTPFLKVVDGSDHVRDVLTPVHDEKTLIFRKHSSLAPVALALVEQESSHCSSLDIDTPFLKVVDGSDHERDVLADA